MWKEHFTHKKYETTLSQISKLAKGTVVKHPHLCCGPGNDSTCSLHRQISFFERNVWSCDFPCPRINRGNEPWSQRVYVCLDFFHLVCLALSSSLTSPFLSCMKMQWRALPQGCCVGETKWCETQHASMWSKSILTMEGGIHNEEEHHRSEEINFKGASLLDKWHSDIFLLGFCMWFSRKTWLKTIHNSHTMDGTLCCLEISPSS